MMRSKLRLWAFSMLAICILPISCSEDDEVGEAVNRSVNETNIDPGIEEQISKDFPLAFKYRLEGDKVTFVKEFDGYRKESWEATFFKKNSADSMAQEFARLIPYDMRKEVPFLYFTASKPEGESFSGFVQSIHQNKNTHWLVAMGIGAILSPPPGEENWFASTAIHEYAHIKSLNSEQANHKSSDICQDGELDAGNECLKKDSYLLAFYNVFWAGIIGEWNKDSFKYYETHKEDFVTGYAASNYSEDFADTFMTFVMEPDKRQGETLADKKVNFFYQYPYWTSIRDAIRKNL